MVVQNIELSVRVASSEASEGQDKQVSPRAYHAPELHDIGKAGELVQGGGGGNYLDANRSRYY